MLESLEAWKLRNAQWLGMEMWGNCAKPSWNPQHQTSLLSYTDCDGFISSPFGTPHMFDLVLAGFGIFLGDPMHPSIMLTAD